MAKNMEIPLLYDFYGDMLTDKQRDMIEQYYQHDLSLSEIAENAGISRQGVRDSIKRAEIQLFDMEERLGLAARMKTVSSCLDSISQYSNAIREKADAVGCSEIGDDVNHLTLLVEHLRQTIV